MDQQNPSPAAQGWPLPTYVQYLAQAQASVHHRHALFSRTRLKLAGACAIYLYCCSSPKHHVEPSTHPVVEVYQILQNLKFPPFHVPYRFQAEDTQLSGLETWDLDNARGDYCARVDIEFFHHHIPSNEFGDSVPETHSQEVVGGIWLVLDLIQNFVGTTGPYPTSAYLDRNSNYVLSTIETAASTLALLLYCMDRLAQRRSSLGLIGFTSDREICDEIVHNPHFERYIPTLYWFCTFRGLDRFATLGFKYYTRQIPLSDDRRVTLVEDIRKSLSDWQKNLKTLVPFVTRAQLSAQQAVNMNPHRLAPLFSILTDPDFGDRLPAYDDEALGHRQYRPRSPWLPLYRANSPRADVVYRRSPS